jgi:hypothetical protein
MTPSTPEPTDGITEKFSENTPARKRGRPRRFEDSAYGPQSGRNLPRAYTERSRLNNVYFTNALLAIIKDNPDRDCYRWLCPVGAEFYLYRQIPLGRAHPKVKTVLLTELGRIRTDYGTETMRKVALQLCEDKPKTRDAVQWLRDWRLEKEPRAGNADALYDAIVRTIQDYLDRYPATPADHIAAALWALHSRWEEAPDGPSEPTTEAADEATDTA